MLPDLVGQLLLLDEADDAVNFLAAFEEDQGGNGGDAHVRGRLAGLVDVRPHDLDLGAHFLRHLLHHGSERLAAPSPFGPEIDQDRGSLEDLCLEGLIVHRRQLGHG